MLAVAIALAGCSSDHDVYNPTGQSEQAHKNFSEAFVSEFGQPDPNQTWGFGEDGNGVRSPDFINASPKLLFVVS